METHYATHTFLGARRVSKKRVVYSLTRILVRFTLVTHAIIKGIIYFLITLGDELVDHFNNGKYPKNLT